MILGVSWSGDAPISGEAMSLKLNNFPSCVSDWVKLGYSPQYTQIVPKWHLAGRLAGTDFFNTRARHNRQKNFGFCREEIWVDLACLKMEEILYLKLWVKLGFSWRFVVCT